MQVTFSYHQEQMKIENPMSLPIYNFGLSVYLIVNYIFVIRCKIKILSPKFK